MGAAMSDLLTHARLEFERSRQPGDPDAALLARRQAAEKAWGYVLQKLDRMLNVEVEDATAHGERRRKLRALQERTGVPLMASYLDLQDRLHGDCFYRGHCPAPEVEWLLQTAEEFPRLVEQALRRARRSP